MLKQLELFQRKGLGNFRDLLIGVAQDPAMLAFLDAGVNVKGAPNENFAREIMELFTMGVGNYTENDIREAARAFTGWNFDGIAFRRRRRRSTTTARRRSSARTGTFDGVQVIDIILEAAGHRRVPRGQALPLLRARRPRSRAAGRSSATCCATTNYEIAPFLETLFLSRDFYSAASPSRTHIKSPVELVVSTYRKLGLKAVPGVPDFNDATAALGQTLSCIRRRWPAGPRDAAGSRRACCSSAATSRATSLFPDINFIPPRPLSRYPGRLRDPLRARAHPQRLDITTATKPGGMDGGWK